jgi:8-oxo-dGTP pyrophosphatase MutT (NUDIX family)
MVADELLSRLHAMPPSEARNAYRAFLSARGHAAVERDGGPEHVTASCFVFSPDRRHVLLCFHRKGGFWVQFGGHIEAQDASIADAARREAREESGITDLELMSESIVDLDRHDLHGGFSCAAHWDVGYVAIVRTDVPIAVSDESEDVGWFPITALPDAVPPGFGARLHAVLRATAGGTG